MLEVSNTVAPYWEHGTTILKIIGPVHHLWDHAGHLWWSRWRPGLAERSSQSRSYGPAVCSGPKDHINIRISYSGSRHNIRRIPEVMFCRILV